MNNIPENVKRIMQNKEMNMNQKMVAFFAFMPSMPANNVTDFSFVGKEIKVLIENDTIKLLGFDKDFKILIEHCKC
jgi:hypothetical protein